MAHALVSLAYRVRGYGAPAKAVLVRLADYANADGTEARPTVQRLADELDLSERAVQMAIKRLLQAGVIVMAEMATNRTPCVYRLNVDLMNQLANAADASRQALGVNAVHHKASRGARDAPLGVHEMRPHPLIHPVDDVVDARDDPVATPEGRAVRDVVGVDVSTVAGWWSLDAEVGRWIAEGCDLMLDILPTVRAAMHRRNGQGPPNSPRYFAKAVADAKAARLAPMPEGQAHAKPANTQRPQDRRYDTDRRRAASAAAVMAGGMASGSDPASSR